MSIGCSMKELVGKTVWAVYVNDDASGILFDLGGGAFQGYEADADCCSESWFSEIDNVQNLLRSEVLEVEEKAEQKAEGTRQEEDIVYGYTLKTAKGYCDILFRNSSNGWYSGWLVPFIFSHDAHWQEVDRPHWSHA